MWTSMLRHSLATVACQLVRLQAGLVIAAVVQLLGMAGC